MTGTEQKLSEAKHFLKGMIEYQGDREFFKYNLSAFLVALRSINEVMGNEFDKVPGFKKWHKIEKRKIEADERLEDLRKIRNINVHKKPVQPGASINVNLSERVTAKENIIAVVKRGNGTLERYESGPKDSSPIPAETGPTVQWRWYFTEKPDIDVVTVCEQCLVTLESVISECLRRFGNALNAKGLNTV